MAHCQAEGVSPPRQNGVATTLRWFPSPQPRLAAGPEHLGGVPALSPGRGTDHRGDPSQVGQPQQLAHFLRQRWRLRGPHPPNPARAPVPGSIEWAGPAEQGLRWRLPDFVGTVEAGAADHVSGHGVDCIGDGELVGHVEPVVHGEQLEDVGVWSV